MAAQFCNQTVLLGASLTFQDIITDTRSAPFDYQTFRHLAIATFRAEESIHFYEQCIVIESTSFVLREVVGGILSDYFQTNGKWELNLAQVMRVRTASLLTDLSNVTIQPNNSFNNDERGMKWVFQQKL